MAVGERLVPSRVVLDLAESLQPADAAKFIKNLSYEIGDSSGASATKGSQEGIFRPLQSIVKYVDNFTLPDGYNHPIGGFAYKQRKEAYAFIYNDKGNHTIYRINGLTQTIQIVKQGLVLNFQLNPRYFIHDGGCILETVYVEDPATGLKTERIFLNYTDGFNDQRSIAVEDAIATNGFDKNIFPYFNGDYDPKIMINMGLPTPSDCIDVQEIPRTMADEGVNNALLFNTWQFRVSYIDVWGRPSEHGIISNMYIPGINDCLAASNNLARCLALSLDAGNPMIDKIQIEFRNCNSQQWYIDQVLFLYVGSNIGAWWLRQRNPDIVYDSNTNKITYQFCRDKECNPIAQTETNRIQNPLGRTSESIAKINQFLGIGGNKYGFNPFPKDILDKIKLNIIPPKEQEVDSRTITIYIPIWNEALNNYQSVRKDGTSGYTWGDDNSRHGGARSYLQYFKNIQQSGFAGYLLGDGNLAFSTQVYLDGSGNLVDDPEFLGQNLSPTQFTMQKFVFNNMPKGVYIFRLASHLSDPAAGDNFIKTSTTVWGLCPFNKATFDIRPEERAPYQELVINVCDKDYNSLDQTQILVIADMAAFVNNESYKATSGYIYESRANGFNENPMELMQITSVNGFTSHITDHNGFYYFDTRGTGRHFQFNFYNKCQIAGFGQVEGNTGMRLSDHYIDEEKAGANAFPYGDYLTTPCNRVLIKGQAFLTDKNIGVPSATIVLSRGSYTTTDDDGNFTLIAHDEVGAPSRKDILIFANGVCNYTGVDGSCISIKNITIIPCAACTTRILQVGQYLVSYFVARGLLSGGTYGWGIVGWDWLKRATFVQPLPYFTIPSIIQSKAIAPSQLEIEIPPDIMFPPETIEITFWITAETTMSAYLDWTVDRFELIDNTGNLNSVSPTQIKIYYDSIIEYNKQNNFNTTTAWNFIPEGQNIPVISDKVQFLLNGDGKFFNKAITALVKYDKTGQFFLIDYTPELADLVAGGMMRLIRPKVCTGNEPYFEICSTIKIKNRFSTVNKFILNAFDTYYLSRQIPVPIPVTPTPIVQNITTSSSTGGVTTATTVTPVPATTANAQKIFGFRFEHNSPSNFWGQGCANFGRVNTKNPYETVIYKPDEIALSGAFSANGQLNYTNYFDVANNVSFNAVGLNGIVAIFAQYGIIAVIGQNNSFVVGFNDTIPTVNAQGQLTIPSAQNQFGNPQEKIGGNYGCMLEDKFSIGNRQGLIQFVDSTEMIIAQYDFTNMIPLSTIAGVDGYVRSKIASIKKYNLTNTNKRYFSGVVNVINNEYLLTDQIIRSANFMNESRQENPDVSETMAFGIYSKVFKGWYGPIPPCYISLPGENNDNQLFSLPNGIPYYHYSTSKNNGYGKAYGITMERVFDVIVNLDDMKKKKPLSIGQYSTNSLYFCDRATSSDGQNTRMLIAQWLQANYGWYAPFLMNLSTLSDINRPDETGKNALMDGDNIVGNWIRIRLVGSPDSNENYSELQGIVVQVMATEKSGT